MIIFWSKSCSVSSCNLEGIMITLCKYYFIEASFVIRFAISSFLKLYPTREVNSFTKSGDPSTEKKGTINFSNDIN